MNQNNHGKVFHHLYIAVNKKFVETAKVRIEPSLTDFESMNDCLEMGPHLQNFSQWDILIITKFWSILLEYENQKEMP